MRLHPARAAGMIRAPWTPGWARDELWRRARATPSLDLRFADSKSLVDATTGQNLVTFTRASEATFVNSQGQIQTAAINAPRFDHNPTTGESLGLLVEEARTNLLLRSEEFNDASWVKTRGSITSNATTAPNGTLTADLFVPDTSANTHFVSQVYGAALSTTYTMSCFVKSAGVPAVSVRAGGAGYSDPGSFWSVSLTTGALLSGSGALPVVRQMSDGWWRITSTVTTDGTVTTRSMLIAPADATGAINFTGDGTSGIYLWGAQLEAGAFPTSYIPTTGTAATRSADVASITGSNFSSWFRGDESTVFVDCALLAGSALTTSTTRTAIDITDGTATNRLVVRGILNTTLNDQITVRVGGGTAINLTTGATVSTAPRKIAAAFRANDTAAVGTGATSVATADTGSMPIGLNQANIGSVVALTNQNTLSGTIARLAYWPARLGNEVLQRITQ